MAAHSTAKRPSNKSNLPPKPYDGFPLFPHGTGKWAKRIRKQVYYFGNWARRIDKKLVRAKGDGWKEALALYDQQKDDLHAGRKPRLRNADGLTVMDLCNRFLTAKKRNLESGRVGSRCIRRLQPGNGQDHLVFRKDPRC